MLRTIVHALLVTILLASPVSAEEREIWYKVSMAGMTVGLGKDRWVRSEDGDLLENFMEINVSRFGTPISMVLRSEELDDAKGRLTRFRTETVMSGTPMVVSGERKGKYIHIEEQSGGYTKTRTIKWEQGAIGYAQLDRMMREAIQGGRDEVLARTFDPQTATFQDVRFAIVGRLPLDGIEHVIVEQYIDDGKAPAATFWVDTRDYEATRIEIDQLGIQIAVERIDESEVATLEIDPNFDILTASMIVVEGYPDKPSALEEVTFRIEFSGEVADADFDGPNQQVVERGDGHVDIRVSRETLGDESLGDGEAYLMPGRYIQSDHPRIKAAADSVAAASGASGEALAVALQAFVHQHISDKGMGLGFATSLDVLDSRQGDCTEHAVLLTSLMRAAGIPSRVSVGVAYFDGFLIGHMWSEAYTGRWQTFDAVDLNNDPVRIRLLTSSDERALNQTDLVNAYGLLGGLTVKVIDFHRLDETP